MCTSDPLRRVALPVAATKLAEARTTVGTTMYGAKLPTNAYMSKPATTNAQEISFETKTIAIHAGQESEAAGKARTTSATQDTRTTTSTAHETPSHASALPPTSAARSPLNFQLTKINANAASIRLLAQTSVTLMPSSFRNAPTSPKTSNATGSALLELEGRMIEAASAKDAWESSPTVPRLVKPSFAYTVVPTFTHTPVKSVK
mmetsp:Transcript_19562/g.47266  ORF Transcript_19562/g.47266 Transcript_19562/m.47266 type:complete len:204 (-) Transcript_19562:698-1309(-)